MITQETRCHDVTAIKQAAEGRWTEILTAAGFPVDVLDGNHHPCPKCGGTDRFRFLEEEAGAVYCNQCFDSKNGDGIAAIQWVRNCTFAESRDWLAKYLNIHGDNRNGKPSKHEANGRAAPTGENNPSGLAVEQLLIRQKEPKYEVAFAEAAKEWCDKKRPITPSILQKFGCQLVGWPARLQPPFSCLIFPGRAVRAGDTRTRAGIIYRVDGEPFPAGGGIGERKVHTLKRSKESWLWPGALDNLKAAKVIVKTEGLPDALALYSLGLPDDWTVVTNACGAKSKNLRYGFSKGKRVFVIGDTDDAGREGQRLHAQGFIDAMASEVSMVLLPPDQLGGGDDIRDYLNAGHTLDDVLRLCDDSVPVSRGIVAQSTAPTTDSSAGDGKPLKGQGGDTTALRNADEIEPATEAAAFLAARKTNGFSHLVFHRGNFHLWRNGRYVELEPSETLAHLILHINRTYRGLTTGMTNNVMAQVRALSLLASTVEPPAWLDKPPMEWPAADVLATIRELVHLPSLVADKECSIPATPQYFSPTALEYEFDVRAPEPTKWIDFLRQLWPDDPESIGTLQEWFGYCLTNNTSQQKILLIVGPTRGGKGVVSRVMTGLVGRQNVAGPTLASFETNFGLSPLLGKTLAIIADARLGGRVDQSKIVERLLSISGEDSLTVDRKYREPVTGKVSSRLMILSNEIPRLAETSGALSARMIILRLANSWLGKEDPGLAAKLLTELPGILLWAVAGFQRLRKRGHFNQPASGIELADEMADLSSPIGKFVRDCCDVSAGCQVAVDDVYRAWCDWCKPNGREHPGTKATFGRDLRAAVAGLRIVQHRENGKRYRYYEGLRL